MVNRIFMLLLLAVGLVLPGCKDMEFTSPAEWQLAEAMNNEVALHNQRARLPFDARQETIIFGPRSSLVRQYDLPVAYIDYSEPGRSSFVSLHAVRYPGCRRERGEFEQFSMTRVGTARDTCILERHDVQPPEDALIATQSSRMFERDGVEIVRWETTIQRPGGQRASVVRFAPKNEPVAMEPLLASALGLRPRTDKSPGWFDPAQVDRLIAERTAIHVQSSDRQIAELAANGRLGKNDVLFVDRVVAADITRNASALTRQFERGLSGADPYAQTALISDLLARLPEAEWVLHRREFLSILMANRQWRSIDGYQRMTLRLSDLGVDAAPLIVRLASEPALQPHVSAAACRIGPAATPQLRRAMLDAWKKDNQPVWDRPRKGVLQKQLCEKQRTQGPPDDATFKTCWRKPDASKHLYQALKRMGEGDQADAMAKHRDVRGFQRRYGAISPASPASVCPKEDELF